MPTEKSSVAPEHSGVGSGIDVPEPPGRAAARGSGTVVTMRDIAQASGVSLSTVSRVLNESPSRVPIALETRERILAMALRLGYRPNPFARVLRGAPTMVLGAVVRDFSDPFFAGALEALADEAMAHGYSVLLGHVGGGHDGNVALPAVLEPRRCDAVLILGVMDDQPQLVTDLVEAKQPVVALWQGTSELRFPTVDVDDRKGIAIGLEHLRLLGHERIGFASARLPGDNPAREESYAAFMSERLGGVPDGYLQRCDGTLAGAASALDTLLGLPQPPTAIACSTDLAAVGVLHDAFARGVTIPADLSVIGYDDLMLAAYTIPSLTTLRMPTTEMVTEAVRMAVRLARDPATSLPLARTVFDPSLVVRGSTAPPPRR
jgi:DNA-binding LacI/PurR family transcriptional regulator